MEQMQVSNGSVIRTNCRYKPFVHHYGVLVNYNGADYVLHNPHGGKAVMETVESFFTTRTLMGVFDVAGNGNTDILIQKHLQVQDRPYSVWNWNCEDYVNYMLDENKFYGGKLFLILISQLAITLLLLIILKHINKK